MPDAPIIGEANSTYHSNDAISHSKFAVFLDSPLDFYEVYVAKSRKRESSGSHFDIGSCFHLFMEGGEPFYQQTVINTKFDSWRTKEAKEWKEAQEKAGKIVLQPDEFKAVEIMGARVKANKKVMELIDGTDAEVTWRKKLGKYAVQARFDRYKPGRIIDWKTVPALADFAKNAVNYRYHIQNVFYQEVEAACLGLPTEAPRSQMTYVAVEKEPPYEVQAFQFDEAALAVARAEVMTGLRDLRHCFETGIWTRPEEIQTISLPGWYVAKAEKKLLASQERAALNA
jgi:hypothetical protein